MSDGHHTGPPPASQDIDASQLLASRQAIGVLSRSDLSKIFGISFGTIELWVARGLKTFKPGTLQSLFLASDVAEFLARRETFTGPKKQAARRKHDAQKEKRKTETPPPRPRGGDDLPAR